MALKGKPDPRVGAYRWRPRRRANFVNVSIDPSIIDQLATLSGAMKTLDKAVEKEFREAIRDTFTEPLAAFMQADARAAGRHGPRLARVIEAKTTSYPAIQIGSLAEPTWAGAVFGGQRGTMSAGRKDLQSMRWPRADGTYTRGIINRRQTMQFLPHRGQEGHLVFPTWRRVDRMLSERLVQRMDGFVRDWLGAE